MSYIHVGLSSGDLCISSGPVSEHADQREVGAWVSVDVMQSMLESDRLYWRDEAVLMKMQLY